MHSIASARSGKTKKAYACTIQTVAFACSTQHFYIIIYVNIWSQTCWLPSSKEIESPEIPTMSSRPHPTISLKSVQAVAEKAFNWPRFHGRPGLSMPMISGTVERIVYMTACYKKITMIHIKIHIKFIL